MTAALSVQPSHASVHSSAGAIDIDRIRALFPSLRSSTVILENAGGSQVPAMVADAMRRYMLETYVQVGAGYELSRRCTETVNAAHAFANVFMNGSDRGKTILGASSSQLCSMLADCYADVLRPGDEIIFAETSHEANVNPWFKLAHRHGVVMRPWPVRRESMACELDDLRRLFTDRTKLVCFPHVSNLLGEIMDAEAVVQLAHEAGAKVVVDGVALAPHRAIDVAAWNVDFYFYSIYKVYGPHMAVLFGTHEALAPLTGPNHFFVPRTSIPYKFELGCLNHEGCAGLLALGDYLLALIGDSPASSIRREAVERAMRVMTECELPLQLRVIEWLKSKPGVRIVGPRHGEASRVSTISFVHESKRSAEIAHEAHRRNIGIRNGHMYAHRLCVALGIDASDGVVRISAVHYNSMAEIESLIAALDPIL